MTIATPSDYLLRRDACSYGYFLLAPNHWEPATETVWRALEAPDAGPVLLRVAQPGGKGAALRVVADRALSRADVAEAKRGLTRMLRLDVPAEAVRAFYRVDPRWKRSGRGRLMRSPTMFEDVIKTVTSCNVSWPSTITMNRRLCEVLGRRVGGPIRSAARSRSRSERAGQAPSPWPTHTFPTAERIARARPAMLRGRCRVGYRDARIVALAKMFARGEIRPEWFEDPATSDEAVWEALLELPGIGPYAAANIMQLLGRYARLPVDTESVRHGRTVLGMEGTSAQVMKRIHEHFAPMGRMAFLSYWLELWAFYESKRGPAWTWERETVGASFTASQLG